MGAVAPSAAAPATLALARSVAMNPPTFAQSLNVSPKTSASRVPESVARSATAVAVNTRAMRQTAESAVQAVIGAAPRLPTSAAGPPRARLGPELIAPLSVTTAV